MNKQREAMRCRAFTPPPVGAAPAPAPAVLLPENPAEEVTVSHQESL